MPDENASVPARRDHDNLLVPFERSRPQLPTSEIFFIFLIVKLSSKTTMKEKVDLEIHAVLKGLNHGEHDQVTSQLVGDSSLSNPDPTAPVSTVTTGEVPKK